MNRNIQLLIIEPQNDFCDLPADWRPGSVAFLQDMARRGVALQTAAQLLATLSGNR